MAAELPAAHSRLWDRGKRGGGVSFPLGTSIATTTHGVLMENEFWAKAEATSPRARASLANIVWMCVMRMECKVQR